MMTITLAKVNGTGKVNGRVPRKVLERNLLDVLVDNEDLGLSFNDALDIIEEASYEELVAMAITHLA